MFILLTITNIAAAESPLLSVPESAGLLMFGVILVTVAAFGRWLLRRFENRKDEKKLQKKAEVR